ncbi:hypothetical protein Sste5346_000797 [Sporothrix stenoceras]|uniref:Cell wall protein n=1 Tax=Sporothrix stenoceras TaxID=5173 RepID=A0ABR3ZQB8_9PEZI
MKFSTIAGVAAFASGVFAAPNPGFADRSVAVAPVQKRVDLSSVVSQLTGEVADVVDKAEHLTAKVQVASSLGDATLVANLTSDLVTLNISLTGVVDLLNELGLGSVAATAEGVVDTAEGVAGGVLSLVTGAVSTVLNTAGGLLSGLTGAATSTVGGVVPAAEGATTSTGATGTEAVTSALGSLTSASALTSLLGGLLQAVGDLLGNLTVTISTGSLGDISQLTNLTSGAGGLGGLTGGVTGAVGGVAGGAVDPVADLSGTLEGLVAAAVVLLGTLLGGL